MNTLRITQLATVPASTIAHLYALPMGGIDVDEVGGVIRNVAVMTIGPAKGHGFEVDSLTLKQTLDCLAAMPDGARIRLKHPKVNPLTGIPEDGTGTMVGRLRNARIDGSQIRGDIHIGAYAAAVPGVGDARTYLLKQAKEDPAAIGLSTVIHWYHDPQPDGRMPARVTAVDAVDFAEDPAANPRGLLSSLTPPTNSGVSPGIVPLTQGGPSMDLLKLLQSLGLDPSATTPEQIDAFVNKLAPEQKAQAEAAGWKAGWAPLSSTPPAAPAAPTAPAAPLAAAPAAPVAPLAAVGTGVNLALLEAQRVTQIRQLATVYQLGDEFAGLHIGMATTPEAFQVAARAELARKYAPTGRGNVQVGEDLNIASLAAGVSDGIRLRAGLKVENPHERSREFRGLSLAETARAYLSAIGVDTRLMGRNEVCRVVFDRGRLATLARAQLAYTPGDFPNILGNTINRTLRDAYAEEPQTWNQWARRGTVNDFRTVTRTQLSEGPALHRIKAGGEYRDGSLTESAETFKIGKFGRTIPVTWELLVNDDTDAFSRIPAMMGRACKRLESDLVYYVLLKNAAMVADGLALFHTTHKNLAAVAGAPSKATLNKMVEAMQTQKDIDAKTTIASITPEFLLVPPALAGETWELLNSTSANNQTNANVKNRFGPGGQVPLTSIVESRLQTGVTILNEDESKDTVAGSDTAWFGAASSSMVDTVELNFLAGEEAPFTEEQDGFRIDGRTYKVRHCAVAKALDYRGLFKNPGA